MSRGITFVMSIGPGLRACEATQPRAVILNEVPGVFDRDEVKDR